MLDVAKFASIFLKLTMRRNILPHFLSYVTRLLLCLPALQSCLSLQAQNETPDRGLVVAKGQREGQYFASWRLLKRDPRHASFTLLRDGKVYKRSITGATSMIVEGTPTSRWQVVCQGEPAGISAAVLPWSQPFLTLHVLPPPAVDGEKGAWTYTANDCSIGDVDGDGQYELFLKWSPTNERDNSSDGYTGNVYISCYKLDMVNPQHDPRCLWTIDLGKNIGAGAHYTQLMVADFDGDGRAEMMCKTARARVTATGPLSRWLPRTRRSSLPTIIRTGAMSADGSRAARSISRSSVAWTAAPSIRCSMSLTATGRSEGRQMGISIGTCLLRGRR